MSRRGRNKRGLTDNPSIPLQDVRSQRIERVRMFSKHSKRLFANATLDRSGVLTIEVGMTPLWQHWLRRIIPKAKVLA